MREQMILCSQTKDSISRLEKKCIDLEAKFEMEPSNIYYCEYLDTKSQIKYLESRYKKDCSGLFSLFFDKLNQHSK